MAVSAKQSVTERSSVRVLHVDDDPDFVDLAATFLEREGGRFSVTTATSAKDGLEKIADEVFDCVVSDYDMPGRNGIEFLIDIREDYPDLPFILFTGKGSEEVASEAISAGVTDYLQKEGGTDQYAVLANRIENAVAKNHAEKLTRRAFRAMDSSREGIALLDEGGEFIYVNQAYTDIVGYDQAELVGEFWERVYPEDQVDRIYDEIIDAVPDEGRWTGETVYQRKDGSRVLVNHALTYSEDGTMICLIRDVTDTEDDKVALHQERQRFELFIDAVEEYAIFTLDPDGYVSSWNAGAERMKGYDRDEILGDHFSKFYPEHQREQGLPGDLLQAAIEDGSVKHQGPRVRKDGATFQADVTITAVYDDTGNFRGFVKVVQDVTEKLEHEQERQAAQRYRQELFRVTSAASLSDDEKIQRLLDLGCERLDVENGHLVAIDEEHERHEILMTSGSDLTEVGDVSDLSETYCRKTIQSEDILAVHDAVSEGWADDPAYEKWRIGCYLGGKLLVKDEVFGTLCFVNRAARDESFTTSEKTFIDLMSRWISQILERRQHVEDLRVKERAMDAAPIGILLTDPEQPDNPIIYANEGFERLTGYSESDITNRNCRFLQGPDTAEGPVEEMRWAIDEEEPVTVQLRNYRKDGTMFWNQVSIAPVGDDGGGLSHFVGFQQDITAQREQQAALENHERVLREMYDIMADRDRSFKDQVRDLLKLGRTELNTAYGTLSQIRGEDYHFEVVDAADSSIKEGDVVPVSATNCEIAASTEQTLVLGDIKRDAPEETDRAGFTEWGIACYIGAPVYDDDDVYGTFCFYDTQTREGQFSEWEETLVDLMSRWVSYELQRQQANDRLQRQNEQLEEFTSVVSHDLRNPLNVAEGRTALAREEFDSEHLDAVERAHERMKVLIEDLLTLAREGHEEPELEPVEFVDLVESCWQNVETVDAKLSVEFEQTFKADRNRLRQLLENLIRNAVEHGGNDVTITIGALENGFYVADDGPGIPTSDRESVFESGYSTEDGGTGFGLSIVKQIVEAHGWEIAITDSDLGGVRMEITGVEFLEK